MRSVEDGEGPTVVTKRGHVFPAVRCEELDGQLVAEARSYHQSRLPHQSVEDLDTLFPKAEACAEAGDQDPDSEDTLEQHGLRIARRGTEEKENSFQGSTLGYFGFEREGQTVSLIQCAELGLHWGFGRMWVHALSGEFADTRWGRGRAQGGCAD